MLRHDSLRKGEYRATPIQSFSDSSGDLCDYPNLHKEYRENFDRKLLITHAKRFIGASINRTATINPLANGHLAVPSQGAQQPLR
ncbi:hypothetical protein KIN20_015448 [Parelaphostrongylus tenuis]|uniref:Uncharacterized protein n=1 Tax=Parelaphostrongylus tenuis TaxID=148309 RepID=A0AAD5MXD3_PARTN|nr:hypothetical protein KIN20_015448 [Parelaphostrongylus tenuis]